MVVVFFGTPQFAVPTLRHLLDSPHRVAGVVTQPDRPRGRGQKVTHSPVKALALERGLPVFQPDRLKPPDVSDTLRAWQPDLGVVAAYGRIIPEQLLTIPRLGMTHSPAALIRRTTVRVRYAETDCMLVTSAARCSAMRWRASLSFLATK